MLAECLVQSGIMGFKMLGEPSIKCLRESLLVKHRARLVVLHQVSEFVKWALMVILVLIAALFGHEAPFMVKAAARSRALER